MRRILFIAHDDSFTGGPMALLRLLRIVKDTPNANIDILIINRQGKLYDDFSKVASNVFSLPNHHGILRRIAAKVSLIPTDYSRTVKKASKYDIVIFNTVVALNYFKMEDLRLLKKKVLLIYEMPIAIELMLGRNQQKLGMVDIILSPSLALSAGLLKKNIPAKHIKPLNQYLDPMEGVVFTKKQPPIKRSKEEVFRVGMIGTPEWAKGIDIFILIAKRYRQRYPECRIEFIWKGIFPGHHKFPIYSEDVKKSGLEGIVRFEGITDAVDEFYNSLDLLALSSREDTFPYAIMESALWSIPTVCFAGSGGAEDFVESYKGFVVPYLDIEGYVNAIHTYYHDGDLLERHGLAAKDFIIKNHGDKSLIKQQFYDGLGGLSS